MIIERYYIVLEGEDIWSIIVLEGPLEYDSSREIHGMIIERYCTVLEGEDL
jgi:hypothetical protein